MSQPNIVTYIAGARGRIKRDTHVESAYRVPLTELGAPELEAHRAALTLKPRDLGYSDRPPACIACYELTATHLVVPRFYGVREFGPASTVAVSAGEPLTAPFAGTLNSLQRESVDRALARMVGEGPRGTMLVLPCGYGKTVCGLAIAAALGRRTLCLVHKAFLVSQWQERVAQFLPTASFGKIQQNTVDGTSDIVIGMIQSLAARDYSDELLRRFGTIIVDEAHHMSAPVFSQALRKLPAKHIIALSATPDRPDGLTPMLHWSMGEICQRVQRKAEATRVTCAVYSGQRVERTYRNGKIALPLMLNDMALDGQRNQLIADRIALYVSGGRTVIVLTDRLAQLQALYALLTAGSLVAEDIAFYVGSTRASDREHATKRAVILSTYSMAKEGLDIPRLDTLVLATPKGDVEQAIGRIQRRCDGKQVPLVCDVCDDFSFFAHLNKKRLRFYRLQKFETQSLSLQDAAATAWYR